VSGDSIGRSAPTTIVVPTIGRTSLVTLVEALTHQSRRVDAKVILVDDTAHGFSPDLRSRLTDVAVETQLLTSGGRGPAAARNVGWRHARTPWVSFLDDDVVPPSEWYVDLLADLAHAGPEVAGSQGVVQVPLPRDRRPTDWERSTAGLEGAPWITADLSYRRSALAAVGGFDERFPRAYREDSELGLRVTATAGRIEWGRRRVLHPVRPADGWVSVRRQAGNIDDALMRRLHGRDWRARAQVPQGRLRLHALTAAAAPPAAAAGATGNARVAGPAALAWAGLTGEFAAARVRPGPRDPAEIGRMAGTSVVIPFVAVACAVLGRLRHRNATRWCGAPDLVLLDRDGTLVHDVPYNADPDAVAVLDGVRESLDRLRNNGIRIGVVTNQSGVGRGLITPQQLEAVNRRIDDLLGPFDVWCQCLHAPEDGCSCRKPQPQLVLDACARLDVDPHRAVVVGDIGSDVEAAVAAGATGVLVPTAATRPAEVAAAAPRVRSDLPSVVDDLLGGRW
jgi:HAD superfamily hydrolase (TIGR01662 family)